MEIPSVRNEVTTSGTFEESDFTIANTKHTFDILSSGLYSDKPRAIVRELSCNAWDGHVAAGNQDTPFTIYLPNRMEPYFKIRDFGTGLDHDFVMKNYTKYMLSTKQGTNDQIGCFGLGSKSPFAYTNNWQVVSYQDGEKRTYNMIIKGNGLPGCIHVATQDTDEPNGLEVSFAVKNGDRYDFEEAAQKVLRVFSTKPEVKGITRFQIQDFPEGLISGDIWTVFKGSTPYGMPEQVAIMGNVEYPLVEQRQFSISAKAVLKLPIMIKFPIGSFEVTPSRESVSWTEYSINSVNQILEDIYESLTKEVNTKISGASTLWEARKETYKFLYSSSLKTLKVTPSWKGQPVTPQIKVPSGCVVYQLTSKEVIRDGTYKMACTTNKTATIAPVDTEFFLADFKSATYRVSGYVRDFDDKGKHVYLIQPQNKKGYKELLKTIGISAKTVRIASSIPKKKRTYKGNGGGGGTRSKHSGSKSKVFVHNGYRASNSDANWDSKEVEMDDGGVYVQIHRYKVVTHPSHSVDIPMESSSLGTTLEQLKALNLNVDVIGVKTAKVEKFQKHPKWITLTEFIRAEIQKVWDADSWLRMAHWLYQEAESDRKKEDNRHSQIEFLRGAKRLLVAMNKDEHTDDPESKFIKFFEIVSNLMDKKEKASAVSGLSHWWKSNMRLVSHYSSQDRTDFSGKLTKHYPLLKMAAGGDSYYDSYYDNRLWETKTKYFVEYIRFIDALRAQGVEINGEKV